MDACNCRNGIAIESAHPNAGAERSSLTNTHAYIREQLILTNTQLMAWQPSWSLCGTVVLTRFLIGTTMPRDAGNDVLRWAHTLLGS